MEPELLYVAVVTLWAHLNVRRSPNGQMGGQINQIARSQSRAEEAIFGNGRPGIKAEMDDLHDDVAQLKQHREEKDQEKKRAG